MTGFITFFGITRYSPTLGQHKIHPALLSETLEHEGTIIPKEIETGWLVVSTPLKNIV